MVRFLQFIHPKHSISFIDSCIITYILLFFLIKKNLHHVKINKRADPKNSPKPP